MPSDATRVHFFQRGGWAYCRLDKAENVNRCRIYSLDGERLLPWNDRNDPDDVFLKYEGDGPVPEDELKIEPSLTGPVVVWLRSGIVLLPRSDYEVQKRYMDDVKRSIQRDGGLSRPCAPGHL